jgi:hypothetical protein
MTLAGFCITAIEIMSIELLFHKYFPEGGATVEQFICRAPIEDVVKLTIHQRSAFFGMCILSMGRLFNV